MDIRTSWVGSGTSDDPYRAALGTDYPLAGWQDVTGAPYSSGTYVVAAALGTADLTTIRQDTRYTLLEPDVYVSVQNYGASGDGVTDDTTAIQSALNAAAVHGATLYIPPGVYLCAGALTIPTYTASNVLRMRPLRITGAAPGSSFGYAANGGSVLLLRGGNADGKIELLGHGYCEIDHLTLADDSGSTVPFIYDTNAVLHLHDCTIRGSQIGTACNQDVVILGGTGTVDDGTAAAPFAGYGSSILGCEAQGIRRLAYLRRYANGVVIARNSVAGNCGSNLPGGASIEIDGQATGNDAHGNMIEANIIEVSNYPYGIRGANGHGNTLAYNGCYDATTTTLAGIRLESTLTRTLILSALQSAGTAPLISDASGGSYTLIS